MLNLLKPKSFLAIILKATQTKFNQTRIMRQSFFFQIPVPEWEKTKKWNNSFWVTKRGSKFMTNLSRFYRLHIGAKRLQVRAKIFRIGTRGISNRCRTMYCYLCGNPFSSYRWFNLLCFTDVFQDFSDHSSKFHDTQ